MIINTTIQTVMLADRFRLGRAIGVYHTKYSFYAMISISSNGIFKTVVSLLVSTGDYEHDCKSENMVRILRLL